MSEEKLWNECRELLTAVDKDKKDFEIIERLPDYHANIVGDYTLYKQLMSNNEQLGYFGLNQQQLHTKLISSLIMKDFEPDIVVNSLKNKPNPDEILRNWSMSTNKQIKQLTKECEKHILFFLKNRFEILKNDIEILYTKYFDKTMEFQMGYILYKLVISIRKLFLSENETNFGSFPWWNFDTFKFKGKSWLQSILTKQQMIKFFYETSKISKREVEVQTQVKLF